MRYSSFSLYALILLVAAMFLALSAFVVGYVVGGDVQIARFRGVFSLLEQKGYLPVPQDNVRDVMARIVRVEPHALTVRVVGQDVINPFRSRGPVMRTVMVTDRTQLSKLIQRRERTGVPHEPPLAEPLGIKDLVPGDMVHITAETTTGFQSSFTAASIEKL